MLLMFKLFCCANVKISHQSSNPRLLGFLPLRDDILAFKVARNTSFLAILIRSICRVWTRLETKNQGETAGETLPTGLDIFFPMKNLPWGFLLGLVEVELASSSLDISTLKNDGLGPLGRFKQLENFQWEKSINLGKYKIQNRNDIRVSWCFMCSFLNDAFSEEIYIFNLWLFNSSRHTYHVITMHSRKVRRNHHRPGT